MTTLYDAAVELHAAGITVIPVRSDGSKAPAISAWQKHQTTAADIDAWFADGGGTAAYTAMGVVTGAPSGNLELTEIEGPYAHRVTDLAAAAQDAGLADLWARLNTGWLELSPSGGLHWVYRVTGLEVPGNTKVAQTAGHVTIAETRGQGGQFVAAPTGGHAHGSGRPWARVAGGPATVPTLTAEEREDFHALLRMVLDERHQADAVPAGPRTPSAAGTGPLAQLAREEAARRVAGDGITPGDDYEARHSWGDLLAPEGWRVAFTRGTTTYWTRPGKRHGISATTGHADDRDRLYVFTSNASPFEPETPYTLFGAYALLHHGGDHTAAARALADHGYGRQPAPAAPAPAPAAPSPAPVVQVEENAADMPAPAASIIGAGLTPPRGGWGDTNEHGVAALRSHQRMSARLGTYAAGRLRYIAGTETGWHHWDGKRWAPDRHEQQAYTALREVLALSWAETLTDKDLGPDVKAGMSSSGSAGTLAITARDPRIALADVDTDPYLLNVQNGTIDLRTLTLRPHDPADNITKVTAAAWHPDAPTGRWAEWVPSVLPDPEVRAFMQRVIGYSLIGRPLEHVFPIAHGEQGRNGKSLMAGTILRALGDYGVTVSPQMLIRGRYGDTKSAGDLSALMTLRGARLAVMSELNKGDAIDEAEMKALTGGDRITAKYMGRDMVTFDPSHTFLMLTNPLPSIPANSAAAWARVRIVPFTQSFEGREDTSLEQVLAQDLDGVLAWAIDGLRDYQARGGLDAPGGVLAASQGYRETQDPVARFIEDRCVLHGAATCSRRALYEAYSEWSKDNGESEFGQRNFNDHVRAITGISETKYNGARGWLGVGLAAVLADDGEPANLPQGELGWAS